MKLAAAIFLMLVSLRPAVATDKNKPAPEPIAWGQLTRISGCVIFKEGQKVSGDFYDNGINIKTTGKLTVIEEQNYSITPKEYFETPEVMSALDQRALKDQIMYVKIPEKYTPELLEKARAICKARTIQEP
jgi:hypothetical protein